MEKNNYFEVLPESGIIVLKEDLQNQPEDQFNFMVRKNRIHFNSLIEFILVTLPPEFKILYGNTNSPFTYTTGVKFNKL